MAKLIYETTLLVCSSCVIFTGTVSAVLLMLVWPNDRILGLSTRMVIGLCIMIVAIFSVGFVGTIAESTNALIIYACLLILFPVSVLLVEIILRLSSLSPPPTSAASNTPPHHNSSDTSATASSASSNHTTSSLNNLNLNENSISFSSSSTSSDPYPSPPFNAFITKPSSVPNISTNVFNLSNNKIHWLLSEDATTIASSITDKIIRPANRSSQSTQLLATILNRPIHDDSDIDVEHKPSSSAKHMSSNDLFTGYQQPPYIGNNDLGFGTKRTATNKQEDVVERKISNKSPWPTKNNDKSTLLNVKGNLLSRIFTASLNPSVETSIEYILIGMLIFVLFQIVISYLLAYKIRTLRIQLKVLSRTRSNPIDSEGEGEEVDEEVEKDDDGDEEKETASTMNNKTDVTNLHVVETSFYTDSICFPAIVDTTNVATFNDIDPATTTFNLCNCCDHHHHHHHHHHQQQQAASTTTDISDNSVHNVFLQTDSRPLVQVHCNPDQLAPNTTPLGQNVCSEHNHGEQILTTTNSSSMDTEDTVISSPLSSSLRTTTTDNHNCNKTNRRTRSGSFRVTFDSLPEFFESSHTVATINNAGNHPSSIMMLQPNDVERHNQNHYLTPSTSAHQHDYYEHQ